MSLTPEEYETLLAGMKPQARLLHRLYDKLGENGLSNAEVIVAALGAAYMRAAMVLGGPVPAMEFVRSYIDQLETEHLNEAAPCPPIGRH